MPTSVGHKVASSEAGRLTSAAAGGHKEQMHGMSCGAGKRKKMIKKKRNNGADMWVIYWSRSLRVYLRYLFYPGMFNPVKAF
jgi:hypothetical protein